MRFLIAALIMLFAGLAFGWGAAEIFKDTSQVQQQNIEPELDEIGNANAPARGNIEARLEQIAENNPEFAAKIRTAIDDADGDQAKLRSELQSLLRENPQIAEEFRASSRENSRGSAENQNRRGRNRS
ncbi:MAG: hypothetical protein CL777_02930 [Chloroflexi bacterium]|nr:hypothetical protein [Chloroflexota bacterium]|tara:strand:+ start:5647 stop:6030 length:384 start_codon:yes stop_codon:yes gene_type:complete